MTVLIPLLGGPGDGAAAEVGGNPLPEFVSWDAAGNGGKGATNAHQFDPGLGTHPERHTVMYRLDRACLRYRYQSRPVS